jgi:hypothetical protein
LDYGPVPNQRQRRFPVRQRPPHNEMIVAVDQNAHHVNLPQLPA